MRASVLLYKKVAGVLLLLLVSLGGDDLQLLLLLLFLPMVAGSLKGVQYALDNRKMLSVVRSSY